MIIKNSKEVICNKCKQTIKKEDGIKVEYAKYEHFKCPKIEEVPKKEDKIEDIKILDKTNIIEEA